MNQVRSLNVQAVALAAGSGLAQVLTSVLYILTARSMQPSEYGLVATAIALGMVCAGLLDFGSGPYWIRELASERMTKQQLNPKVSTKFLLALTASTAIIGVATVTQPYFIATGVLLLSSTAVVMALVPLRGARKTHLVGLLTALSRVIATVAFFFQTAVGVDPGFALWISIAIGDTCVVVYVIALDRKNFRFQLLPLSNPWSGAKWYSLTAISASAQQSDLPLLSAFAGASAAGVYGGVNRWTVPMTLATSSFVSAAAPFLAAERQLSSVRSEILRASWLLGMVIALSVGVIFSAPWLVVFLMGDAYAHSAYVLQWLAGAAIINTISQPLLVALAARQLDHVAAVIIFTSVVAQLTIIAVLGAALGAVSAGIGAFVAQSVQILGAGLAVVVLLRRRN